MISRYVYITLVTQPYCVEGAPQLLPWTKVERWACIHCGFCCSEYDIPVTPDEERRLRKYGNVFKRSKIGVYLGKKRGMCVFRGDDRCRIYDERPMACRKYPFYIKQKGDEDSLYVYNGKVHHIFLDSKCKGLGRGCEIEEQIRQILEMVE